MTRLIRASYGIMLLGTLLYIATGKFVNAPPEAGANIGAGILALLSIGIFLIGACVMLAGIVRWLVRHIGTTHRNTNA